MHVYRRLISRFYPTFEQQFDQQIQKLTSKICIDFNGSLVNFESSVKINAKKGKKTLNFLISSDCLVYEITYLGLPLIFKEKMVRFFNNLQMLIIELPINPPGKGSINLTFKYYCTQSPYISFAENSFSIDNRGGFFPFALPKSNYPAEVELVIPHSWHLLAGDKISKALKHDGQHIKYNTTSNKLSVMSAASLKTNDTFDNISISLLYPRPYLNQARAIINLTKKILLFLHNIIESLSNDINIAIVDGNFNSYFDGANILLSSSFLQAIKAKGKTPKDRERLLYAELARLIPNYLRGNICTIHPDEKWVLEGIIEYLGLAAVKDCYGQDEYLRLIANYQFLYKESVGYKEKLAISKTSKGLGKNLDLNYPLNILLFHSLDFLTRGKLLNTISQMNSWNNLSWEVLEEKLSESLNTNIKWFTKNFITRHRPIELGISRFEEENLILKAFLHNPDSLWKAPVELKLIMDDCTTSLLWDGVSPIQTTGKLKEVVLDPNLYIPGNTKPKIYKLENNDNNEEKVGS